MAKKSTISDQIVSLEDFLASRFRVFMNYWARTGEGKTFLPLGWPKPLYLMNFEPEGPVQALKDAVRLGYILDLKNDVFIIEPTRYALGDSDPLVRTTDEEWEIYDYAKESIQEVLKDVGKEGDGTLFIDTGTTFNATVRECEMEEIIEKRRKQGKEPYQFDFGVGNRAVKHIVDAILNRSSLNLVISNHAKEIHNSKGNPTGRFEYQGSSQLPNWSHLHAQLLYEQFEEDEDGNPIEEDDPSNWSLKIEKSRLNIKLRGKTIVNPSYERIVARLTGG